MAKLVCSQKNKYYLSNEVDAIKELLKISNKNNIVCVFIIKFYGNRPNKANWTIVQISDDMPTFIERNFASEFEYLKK